MKTLKEDLKDLAHECWLLEDKLPHTFINDERTDASEVRRRLYCMRVELGSIMDFVNRYKVVYK